MRRCQMSRSPMAVLALLVILVAACSLSSSCADVCVAASSSSLELELQQEELAPEFRRLLVAKAPERATKLATHTEAAINPNQDCSSKYPKLNFKPVTSVCKPKVPATTACCAAFNKLACQYRSQVNNFNSICPILFLSYLNYAGGYQDGYFIGKCIDGKKGLCV